MLAARMGQSLTGAAPRKLAQQTRLFHTPGRILPSKPTNLAHHTRNFIARVISHFHGPPLVRSVHSAPSTSIRQSLSLPVRVALSRPLRAPCLPRAPRIPGNVAQVGLGTARNFSTGRPVFQHIVENVPVVGRAFYEVDWDLKMKAEKDAMVHRPKKSSPKAKLTDKLQPRQQRTFEVANTVGEHEEFDHYFSAPCVPLTTTYLQIPLAPTPTTRVPISQEPSPRLLPIPTLAKMHASHSKHSIMVASIFRRLDAARVWEAGASCETFGDPSGLCTILRIRFEGWTKDKVNNILGDAGKDWCTIQEIRQNEPPFPSSTLYRPLSPESSPPLTRESECNFFVMPELDFSISSPMPTARTQTPLSHASLSDTDTDYSFPSAPHSAWDDDSVSSKSDGALSTVGNPIEDWSSAASSPRPQSWLGFSSEFADRATSNEHTLI